ncbi:acyl-CoA/acyl-ACP dehydrogenase [Diaphorobacter sp. HDW4A]|uniref:acyl-CoA dehydrogenase family protein n=1 Tax=Diaphorobacter sp. HDW4A TaxID=2714924 RepID=UPI00140CF115|nr:acyl-CoA dehydrogenase family protein [Diaphorobacter sp. HDW4A]QIL82608.1 acyl-CoA/acyl-ACP dehydrogenase [Diaphorobacter sp. HDW4A]
MDFALNEEQQMLYESAQRFFVDNHPTARARKALPLSDAAQQKLWSDMAGMGWMSLLAPESMDGLGLGITEAYLVAEAGGRQLLNLPWASSAVLLPLWVQSLEKNAPEALLTLLSGILSGERVVHCVDERDPTRDFASQCTDLLVVRGLHDARQPLQFALTSPTTSTATTTAFGLDPTVTQSQSSAESLSWQTLELSTAGREHARAAYRLMLCAELIGVAQSALQLGAAYAAERVQFGKPIGSYQAIKHQLANAWMAMDNARLAALYASAALDGRLPDARFACAAAEFTAMEGALNTTRCVIQVHGGMGFTWEHDAHLYLKRAQRLAARLGGVSKALTAVEEWALA